MWRSSLGQASKHADQPSDQDNRDGWWMENGEHLVLPFESSSTIRASAASFFIANHLDMPEKRLIRTWLDQAEDDDADDDLLHR